MAARWLPRSPSANIPISRLRRRRWFEFAIESSPTHWPRRCTERSFNCTRPLRPRSREYGNISGLIQCSWGRSIHRSKNDKSGILDESSERKRGGRFSRSQELSIKQTSIFLNWGSRYRCCSRAKLFDIRLCFTHPSRILPISCRGGSFLQGVALVGSSLMPFAYFLTMLPVPPEERLAKSLPRSLEPTRFHDLAEKAPTRLAG